MIWCLIIVAVLIIGIVLTVVGHKTDIEWMGWIGIIACVVGGFAFCLCGFGIAKEQLNQGADLANLNAKREAIVYQIENGLDMSDSLVKFNSEVEYVHKIRESNWTNWFYGAYWDEVEPVELN